MAYSTGTVMSTKELLDAIVAFLTDPDVFGDNAWELIEPAVMDDEAVQVILKGKGDGQDEIYIGFKVQDGAAAGQVDLVLHGFAGYDQYLDWREQPGSMPLDQKLPIIPLVGDARMVYWLSANTSRIIIVVQLSNQFESAYLGFMKPVGVERQYPYPLVIGGSYIEGGGWTSTSPGHSCFINPGNDGAGEFTTSLRLRRPDGTWRGGQNKSSGDTPVVYGKLCVWPTNTKPTNVLTVCDTSLTIENVIMFPVLLYEMYPDGIVGQFDGVYFIGNREDLASKDTIMHQDKPYKIFNNVFRRDNDEYFTIEAF